MLCECCGSPMLELFFSCVCEFCENPDFYGFAHGFVVWRGRAGESEYVFPSRQHAERYQRAAKLMEFPIRRVLSREPFHFQKSSGTITDLEFADQLYEIFADHRFRWGKGRAFLAPRVGPTLS